MTSSAKSLFRQSWAAVKEPHAIDKPTRAGETLLMVDPLDKQIQNALDLGWALEVLFLGQFWREVPEGVKVYHLGCDAQALDFSPNITYSKIWAEEVLGVFFQDYTFIVRFLGLLKPDGALVLYAKNSKYYQNMVDRASRDLGPWPHHTHKGVEYSIIELEKSISSLSANFEFKAIEDENMSHPNFEKWRQVDGSDCDVVLANLSLEDRKQAFTSGWIIKVRTSKAIGVKHKKETTLELMQKQNLESSQSSHFMNQHNSSETIVEPKVIVESRDKELEAIFSDIEDRLQKGSVEFVDALLTDAASRNPNDSRIFNYHGVLNFYKNENLEAYLCFIDAIEKNDNRQDYWENLWDAGLLIGRTDDVIFLANSRKSKLGFLPGLILSWQESQNS